MSRLPEVNQRIGVLVHEWNARLASRIEESGVGVVSIALPSDGKADFDLPRGIAVDLEWVTPRGLMRVSGRSAGHAATAVPAISVELSGEPEVFQRRDYVRANTVVDIVATPKDGLSMPVNGLTVDLSGGGVQANLPGLTLEVGDHLRVDIDLPEEEPIEAEARVTRLASEHTFCLAFEQIDAKEQERLIRFVFQRLRNAAGKAA